MGMLDGILGKKQKVSSSSVLVLTPLGKTKAEKFDLPGSKWKILNTLNENGPSTISELASETGMDEQKVRAIAKGLASTGYIRQGSSEG
jgi:DNA-binding MarR family transcriptional regulator